MDGCFWQVVLGITHHLLHQFCQCLLSDWHNRLPVYSLVWAQANFPLIPSLPHLLLYLLVLVSFIFPFSLTYALHLFSCSSILPILP